MQTIPDTARPRLPELVDRGLGVSLLAAEVEQRRRGRVNWVWLTLYWRT